MYWNYEDFQKINNYKPKQLQQKSHVAELIGNNILLIW